MPATSADFWLQDREDELRNIAIQMRQRERERRHKEREQDEEASAAAADIRPRYSSSRDLDRRRPRSRSRSRSGSRSRSYRSKRSVPLMFCSYILCRPDFYCMKFICRTISHSSFDGDVLFVQRCLSGIIITVGPHFFRGRDAFLSNTDVLQRWIIWCRFLSWEFFRNIFCWTMFLTSSDSCQIFCQISAYPLKIWEDKAVPPFVL